MDKKILDMMRHIFDARIDNADSTDEYWAWCSAREVVEYALANNYECLAQYDYLQTQEEKESN